MVKHKLSSLKDMKDRKIQEFAKKIYNTSELPAYPRYRYSMKTSPVEQQAARRTNGRRERDEAAIDSTRSDRNDGDTGSTTSSSSSGSTASSTLEGVIQKSDHREIMQRLEKVALGERMHSSDKIGATVKAGVMKSCQRDYRHTVFRHIMSGTVNGDQILCKRLDACVSCEGAGPELLGGTEGLIRLNLGSILEGDSEKGSTGRRQTDIIKDMLAFKNEPAAASVMTHPVMETFLELKWRKVRLFFFLNFFVYLVFLMSYSLFLGDIFYRIEKRERRIIKLSELVIKDEKIYFPEEVALEDDRDLLTTTPPNVNFEDDEADDSGDPMALPDEDQSEDSSDQFMFRSGLAMTEEEEEEEKNSNKKNKTLKQIKNKLFKTKKAQKNKKGKKNKTKNLNKKRNRVVRKLKDPYFRACRRDGFFTWECQFEVVLLVSITLLLVQELMQFYALGARQYLRELENLLEVFVLLLAGLSLWLQYDLIILKWLSAFGICLGYLELIFLMGRYPFLGGSISLMFYSIMRHLVRTLSNFLVLIIGFAFGFFLIHHGKDSDQFSNPGKATLKTLVMVLGEFEFNDLYSAHKDDMYSLIFTMTLMVGLAIMGSLVLVNLIVALIVSDIDKLHTEAHLQSLVNKAQHIIHLEGVARYVLCCCASLRNKFNIPTDLLICAHSICKCKERDARRLEPEITDKFRRILRKKRMIEIARSLKEDGAGKQELDNVGRALARLLRKSTSSKRNTAAVSFIDEIVDMLADGGY